jgi:hypothetical protein
VTRTSLGPHRATYAGTPEEQRILAALVVVTVRIRRLDCVRPDDLDVAAIAAAEREATALRTRLAQVCAAR